MAEHTVENDVHPIEVGEIGRATSRSYCYACPAPIEVGDLWRQERVGNSVPHVHRIVHHPDCPRVTPPGSRNADG